MKEFEKVFLEEKSVNDYNDIFIEQSSISQFYNKNVYFTKNLRYSKYNYFQIIGNLGGIPSQTEFTQDTDFFVFSDYDFRNMIEGIMSKELIELKNKYNSKGKKHTKLKILTEKVFVDYLYKRCIYLNDHATIKLVENIL